VDHDRQISFAGARMDESPLTWAQQIMWGAIKRRAPFDPAFNIGHVERIPGACTLGAFCESLQAVTEDFDVLRTRFPANTSGMPRQVVEQYGSISLRVVDAPARAARETADAIRDELVKERFEYATEMPVRYAVVTTDDHPAYLVVSASHLAFDYQGVLCLAERIKNRTNGNETRRPYDVLHPCDQARFEASPQGRAESDRSLEYQAGVLSSFPVTNFPTRLPERRDAGILRAAVKSPAASLAVARLAHQHGVSPSAVYVAAMAFAIAKLANDPRCIMSVMSSNRYRRRYRQYVGLISQGILIGIDVDPMSFSETIARSWQACLAGYLHSRYNPPDFEALLRAAERKQGHDVAVAFFNDRIGGTGGSADISTEPGPDIRALRGRTKITRLPSPEAGGFRFHLAVQGRRSNPELMLSVDTSYVSVNDVGALFLACESVLIEAATEGANREIPLKI
jgi:hypothetical protein